MIILSQTYTNKYLLFNGIKETISAISIIAFMYLLKYDHKYNHKYCQKHESK